MMLLNHLRCEMAIDEMRNKTDYETKIMMVVFSHGLSPTSIIYSIAAGHIYSQGLLKVKQDHSLRERYAFLRIHLDEVSY